MHLFTESQTCDLGVASFILIGWCLCMKIWLNLCNFSLSVVFLVCLLQENVWPALNPAEILIGLFLVPDTIKAECVPFGFFCD